MVAGCRLSVFAGSFDLSSAVAALDGETEIETLDLLSALVDKSLLTVESDEGDRRYRYLETIRTFAEDRLDESGLARSTADSVLGYHIGRVQALVDDVQTRALKRAAHRLRSEIPNLRRSFEHAVDVGDIDAAAALALPLADIVLVTDWSIRGWASEALAADGRAMARVRAQLAIMEMLDDIYTDPVAERDPGEFDDALAAAGGFDQLPRSLYRIAFLHGLFVGSPAEAFESIDKLLARPSGLDRSRWLWLRLTSYSCYVFFGREGEILDDWQRYAAEALADPSELVRAEAHWSSALLAQSNGDFERMLSESQALIDLRVVGSMDWFSALELVVWAEIELGHIDRARVGCEELVDATHRHVWPSGMNDALALYARLMRAVGAPEELAMICGYLSPQAIRPWFHRSQDELHDWLRRALPLERREELARVGQSMGRQELAAAAREAANANTPAVNCRPANVAQS